MIVGNHREELGPTCHGNDRTFKYALWIISKGSGRNLVISFPVIECEYLSKELD